MSPEQVRECMSEYDVDNGKFYFQFILLLCFASFVLFQCVIGSSQRKSLHNLYVN